MRAPNVMQTEVPLHLIEVRERSRQALVGIDSLAESIRARGLLHPPVVRRDGDAWVLVAGQRRIEALRLLGFERVLVTVATSVRDELSALHAEGEENTERQPFTPEEAVRHRKRIEAAVAAEAKERMTEGGEQSPSEAGSGNLPDPATERAHERTTREVTARGTGYSGRTLDKAAKVVDAAEDEALPEPVRQVAAEARHEMNETGKVDPAHRKVEQAKSEWQPTKPDLGGGVSHPARYSPELVDLFRAVLTEYGAPNRQVLDPFAGTGRIHELQSDGWDTIGIELEPEWANLHPDTRVGDALDLPFDPESFGAIVTSPTYGNRLADSHNASDPERRRSYTHDLGRDLDEANTGTLHWRTSPPGGAALGSLDYRAMHEKAWDEAVLVLQTGGLFILNCCDHVRDGIVQPVTAWHCWALGRLGLDYVESRSVPTRKLRQGANGNLREQEQVHVFRKPS